MANTKASHKIMKFVFFEVTYKPDTDGKFTQAIEGIYKDLPITQDRNWLRKGTDDYYRIESFVKYDWGCQGAFLRLFHDPDLKIGRIDSEGSKDLHLQPGEHLREEIYFMYFDSTRTLVVSMNKNVGNILTMAFYLHDMATDFKSVWFNLRTNIGALDRIKKLATVERMELSLVSGLPAVQRNPGNSVLSVTGLTQVYGGLQIDIVVRKGRGKSAIPLNPESVKQTMTEVSDIFQMGAKKAKVIGTYAGSPRPVPIDLIKDKMEEEEPVACENKSPLPSHVFAAIATVYHRREDELKHASKKRRSLIDAKRIS